MDLAKELEKYMTLLEFALNELRKRGTDRANAEYQYRMKLSQRLTELRSQGQPVTHLLDIAKGEKDIAKLRLDRDIAEALYLSNQEAINVYKLRIKTIESQIAREWHS